VQGLGEVFWAAVAYVRTYVARFQLQRLQDQRRTIYLSYGIELVLPRHLSTRARLRFGKGRYEYSFFMPIDQADRLMDTLAAAFREDPFERTIDAGETRLTVIKGRGCVYFKHLMFPFGLDPWAIERAVAASEGEVPLVVPRTSGWSPGDFDQAEGETAERKQAHVDQVEFAREYFGYVLVLLLVTAGVAAFVLVPLVGRLLAR
jgi:hypothetical protein